MSYILGWIPRVITNRGTTPHHSTEQVFFLSSRLDQLSRMHCPSWRLTLSPPAGTFVLIQNNSKRSSSSKLASSSQQVDRSGDIRWRKGGERYQNWVQCAAFVSPTVHQRYLNSAWMCVWIFFKKKGTAGQDEVIGNQLIISRSASAQWLQCRRSRA